MPSKIPSSSVPAAAVTVPNSLPPWRRGLAVAQDSLLVVISLIGCYAHVSNLLNGRLSSAAFAVEQGLLVYLFLVRRRTRTTSQRPLDWVVAAGGWLPLVMQPHESGPIAAVALGMALQVVGLSFTCVGFIYLGRSFGVVAANRGVKVNGPYRLVRHPIYVSHTATLIGFTIANFTALNIALVALTTVFQLCRIQAEERVLAESHQYRDYRARIRWRLIPGLY
jgi:protein-S-isoprenylcysteine O-methyltransferase Ste14